MHRINSFIENTVLYMRINMYNFAFVYVRRPFLTPVSEIQDPGLLVDEIIRVSHWGTSEAQGYIAVTS